MDNLLLLSIVCFVAMVSPGPDFVLVTRNSLLHPKPQALATAFGVIVGCLIHATYCILGLALIITKSVLLYSVIKYAGACYLIFIGIKGLLSSSAAGDLEIQQSKPTHSLSIRTAFVQGFLCNLLNPKLAIFLLSLFTQFISVDATLGEKLQVASIFMIESILYWPLLVLLLQSSLVQRFFNNMKLHLDRLSGAVLLYLGIRVALQNE